LHLLYIGKVKALHEQDLALGYGEIFLPNALNQKIQMLQCILICSEKCDFGRFNSGVTSYYDSKMNLVKL